MNSSSSPSMRVVKTLIVLGLLHPAAVPLMAQSTWNGGGTTNNWTDSGNWNSLPGAGSSLVFAGSTRLSNSNDFVAGTNFSGLTYNLGAGSFTLGGNAITLQGNLVNNSGVLQTINLDIALTGGTERNFNSSGSDLTINGNITGSGAILATASLMILSGSNNIDGSFRINSGTARVTGVSSFGGLSVSTGTVELAGGSSLILTPGSNRSFGGNLTGSGSLTKDGSARQTLTGSGSGFTGAVTINQGSIDLNAADALGTGTITINSGGFLDIRTAGMKTSGNISGSGGVRLLSGDLTVAGASNESFGGVISSVNSFAKSGTATQTLTGTNTFTGSTTVTDGTLLISGGGSINTTSGVAVNGGTFNYNSSVGLTRNVTVAGGTFRQNSASNYTGALTFTSGTLAGTNFSGNSLSIGANQTIAPGNSTGTMTSGPVTFASLGTYDWEINDATGTAGSSSLGWDLLSITGDLTLSATVGDKFTINVISLNTLQQPGDAENFDSSGNFSFLIADATNVISGFDAGIFAIDTTAFSNAFIGTWSVVRGDSVSGGDNTQLYLTYVVPEPSTVAFLGLAAGALFVRRSRSRKR